MGVHPHTVSILDFGEYERVPYVVTELMGGGDVEGLLEDAEGALPLAQNLEIAKAVAHGLVFAHEQGVIHRDLKPGNVWLTSGRTRQYPSGASPRLPEVTRRAIDMAFNHAKDRIVCGCPLGSSQSIQHMCARW